MATTHEDPFQGTLDFGSSGISVPGKAKRLPGYLDQSQWLRDWSGYDPAGELEAIRRDVSICYPKIFGPKPWWSDHQDDLASECFSYLFEKKVYLRYSSDSGDSYAGYRFRAVRNWMYNKRNSRGVRDASAELSLDVELGDSGFSQHDIIPDSSVLGVAEDFERRELLAHMASAVDFLDTCGTGLSGVSYRDIYQCLIDGKSMLALSRETKYSKKTLQFHREKLEFEIRARVSNYLAS